MRYLRPTQLFGISYRDLLVVLSYSLGIALTWVLIPVAITIITIALQRFLTTGRDLVLPIDTSITLIFALALAALIIIFLVLIGAGRVRSYDKFWYLEVALVKLQPNSIIIGISCSFCRKRSAAIVGTCNTTYF